MTMQVRLWLVGISFSAVLGIAYASASYQPDKDQFDAVKKVVADSKAAKDAAKKFDEVSDLMHLYRPRNKGGLGWGPNAGKNPATDGLEKKIQELAKGVPPNVANDVDNNVTAGKWMAALADITLAKTPAKDASGGKTKKAWADWSKELRDASDVFTKAATAKKGDDMKKAAAKINTICVNCHSKFKE